MLLKFKMSHWLKIPVKLPDTVVMNQQEQWLQEVFFCFVYFVDEVSEDHHESSKITRLELQNFVLLATLLDWYSGRHDQKSR